MSFKEAVVVVSVGCTLLSVPVFAISISHTRAVDCTRDQRTAIALRTIIQRSDRLVDSYRREGVLNAAQVARAHAENAYSLHAIPVPLCS